MQKNNAIVMLMGMLLIFITLMFVDIDRVENEKNNIINDFVENCEIVNVNTEDNVIYLEYENNKYVLEY